MITPEQSRVFVWWANWLELWHQVGIHVAYGDDGWLDYHDALNEPWEDEDEDESMNPSQAAP